MSGTNIYDEFVRWQNSQSGRSFIANNERESYDTGCVQYAQNMPQDPPQDNFQELATTSTKQKSDGGQFGYKKRYGGYNNNYNNGNYNYNNKYNNNYKSNNFHSNGGNSSRPTNSFTDAPHRDAASYSQGGPPKRRNSMKKKSQDAKKAPPIWVLANQDKTKTFGGGFGQKGFPKKVCIISI